MKIAAERPKRTAFARCERLVEIGEAVEGRDRPEDLLAREESVVGEALEQRRREQVGLVVQALAAREHRAAVGLAALDAREDLRQLALVDDRPDLGLRGRPGRRPTPRSIRRASRCLKSS